jgi:uncharacterized protein YggE
MEGARVADKALVSVRGEAQVETEPDIATVEVIVTSRSKDRAETLDVLAGRREHLTALLVEHGGAIEKVEESSTHVRPEYEEDHGRKRIVDYLGTSQFTVTINDFSLIGILVTALAQQEATSVSGPYWALRPDSPARGRARILAAQNALARAREYADAFDTLVVELVEIADLGLLSEPAASPARHSARALSGSDGNDEPTLTFTPVAQTIHATVDARFRIEAPNLTR